MAIYMKAKLTGPQKINVVLFTDLQVPGTLRFELFINSDLADEPRLVKRSSMNNLYMFELELVKPYEFGKRYDISLCGFSIESVDISYATSLPDFDNIYKYDGDDLGNTYTKKETKFAFWSPISDIAVLFLENDKKQFDMHFMERDEHGVWRCTVSGNLKNRNYYYGVRNCGVLRKTNDPYAKGTSLNSQYSTVIDLEELNSIPFCACKNVIKKNVEATIYEVNIRDFTEDRHTDIVEKGKYLGFVEPGRKTVGGHPAGLDYLKFLGVNTVQLQPIHDFRGVQDDDVASSYNWGYDPIHYFALEGSYSSHPEDPLSRLKEFRTMVSELHKNGINVVVDVVYNHIYEHMSSILEKSCPGYYFRKRPNGEISSASGCGNDIATEKYMVRKMIVDSLEYLVNTFDVDGFRFDLMGLIDTETMQIVDSRLRKIKKNIILYGEGWKMFSAIPNEQTACSDNAKNLPTIGFFNEMFRDIVKGGSMHDQLRERGFSNGNIDYWCGLEFVICGSVLNKLYEARYVSASQSINYIECHDNSTLYDKMIVSNPDEDEETILKRIQLANTITIISFGVPFLHMGQEVGLSKNGNDNTYNVPKINNMRWDIVDERWEMVNNLRYYILFRAKYFMCGYVDDPKDIDEKFDTYRWDNNVICITTRNSQKYTDYSNLMILINATNETQTYQNNGNLELINFVDSDRHIRPNIIGPISIQFLGDRKDI